MRCWHKTWVFGKCSNILSYDFNFQRVYADKNDIECHQKFVGETNKPYHEHGRIYRPFLDLECIRMIPPQTPCRNTVKYVDLYMTWNVQLIWMAVGRKLEHDMDMLSGIYIYIYICEAAIETHAMGFPPIYIYSIYKYIYIYLFNVTCLSGSWLSELVSGGDFAVVSGSWRPFELSFSWCFDSRTTHGNTLFALFCEMFLHMYIYIQIFIYIPSFSALLFWVVMIEECYLAEQKDMSQLNTPLVVF